MKKCTFCRLEKPKTEYVKKASAKDGLAHWCHECRKKKKHAEYLKNKDRYLANSAEYRKNNPEKVSCIKKQCRINKIGKYKAAQKNYYEENKKDILAYQKTYRVTNNDKINERDRQYYQRNRSEYLRKQSEYQKVNSEKLNEYRRKYLKQRRSKDKMFAIRLNMRARFKFELAKRGENKTTKVNYYLGCTWVFLRDYLAEKFVDGMSWENYGDWHVDHIIPLASAKTKDQLIQLCHHSNLQPLWAFDNLSKGAKMPDIAA